MRSSSALPGSDSSALRVPERAGAGRSAQPGQLACLLALATASAGLLEQGARSQLPPSSFPAVLKTYLSRALSLGMSPTLAHQCPLLLLSISSLVCPPSFSLPQFLSARSGGTFFPKSASTPPCSSWVPCLFRCSWKSLWSLSYYLGLGRLMGCLCPLPSLPVPVSLSGCFTKQARSLSA